MNKGPKTKPQGCSPYHPWFQGKLPVNFRDCGYPSASRIPYIWYRSDGPRESVPVFFGDVKVELQDLVITIRCNQIIHLHFKIFFLQSIHQTFEYNNNKKQQIKQVYHELKSIERNLQQTTGLVVEFVFFRWAFLRLCEEQEVEVHQLQDGNDYGDEDCPVEFSSHSWRTTVATSPKTIEN